MKLNGAIVAILFFSLGVYTGIYGPVVLKLKKMESKMVEFEKRHEEVTNLGDFLHENYKKVINDYNPISEAVTRNSKKLEEIRVNKTVIVRVTEQELK